MTERADVRASELQSAQRSSANIFRRTRCQPHRGLYDPKKIDEFITNPANARRSPHVRTASNGACCTAHRTAGCTEIERIGGGWTCGTYFGAEDRLCCRSSLWLVTPTAHSSPSRSRNDCTTSLKFSLFLHISNVYRRLTQSSRQYMPRE